MNKYIVENKMKRWQKSYTPAVSLASVAVVLIIWEAICRAGVVSSLFLPPPTMILSSLVDMIKDGEIGVSLAASLYRILMGFFLGSAFGLFVGLVTGTSALADRIANPIVNALYPIPKSRSSRSSSCGSVSGRYRKSPSSPWAYFPGGHEYLLRRKERGYPPH